MWFRKLQVQHQLRSQQIVAAALSRPDNVPADAASNLTVIVSTYDPNDARNTGTGNHELTPKGNLGRRTGGNRVTAPFESTQLGQTSFCSE
jgi:hypothetical protein